MPNDASSIDAEVLADPSPLLTRPEVERLVKAGRSAIYRGIKEKRFPAPIYPFPGCARWRRADVLRFIESAPNEPTTAHRKRAAKKAAAP